jgi:hypothetical protein
MKMKYLSAACALALSAGAIAAPLTPSATVVSAANTLYISGASAQKAALDTVMRTDGKVFAVGADVVKITGVAGSIGYLGIGNAALGGVPFLVIYNSTNGSAAGLNQLLSSGTGEAEATVLDLSTAPAAATCGAVTGGAGTWAATCNTASKATETDMALSDVYKTEFGSSGALCQTVSGACPGPAYLPLSGIVTTGAAPTTGLEGFGVIVNANLYNQLVQQNITDGILPAACAGQTAATATKLNGACQPSLRSRDYAALATKGSGWDSVVLFPSGPAANVSVHRRDELSGTQAASNIYFLNNVCGSKGFGGSLTPARAADSAGSLAFFEQTTTGNVESGVAGSAGYALGVVSLGEKDKVDDATKAGYWFVKLDGVSPNFAPDGSYDGTHRLNMANGSYGFATEMAAYVRTGIGGKQAIAAPAIADAMSSSTGLTPATALLGIAYLDNNLAWPDGIQSKFSRAGNNCAPMH